MLAEMVKKVVEANLQGVKVEVCGSWVWCSGDTFPHRDWFKAAGFRWAKVKKMWYWHDPDQKRSKGKAMPIDWIRRKHGSVFITSDEEVA